MKQGVRKQRQHQQRLQSAPEVNDCRMITAAITNHQGYYCLSSLFGISWNETDQSKVLALQPLVIGK